MNIEAWWWLRYTVSHDFVAGVLAVFGLSRPNASAKMVACQSAGHADDYVIVFTV